MNICIGYKNIPESIVEKLYSAPVFYMKSYYINVKNRKQEVAYIWSDTMILMARIRKEFFLKAALLECEPYVYVEDSSNEQKAFLDEAMKLLKSIGVQWTITTNTARFQEYPTNAKVIRSGNYIVDLTLNEEELWGKMHSKHRNTVRRGEKGKMELAFGGEEMMDEYFLLSKETYERSGANVASSGYFCSLIDALNENSIVAVISKDKKPQAAGMFLFSPAIAYYLHGASTSRPEPGSTNYLLWRTIIEMKEKGVKKFSFVGYHVDAEPGSKLDGIQKFKERFGGELELCYSFRYVQNKFLYNIYCLAMQIRSKKKLSKYQDHIDEQAGKFPELNIKVKKI